MRASEPRVGPQAYFAYGSNMRAERVQQRGLVVEQACSAWIPNFGLRFNKADAAHLGSGHANIVYAPGERVEGVLYRLATEHEILKMDPFEKAPWNYGRDALWVQLGPPGPPDQVSHASGLEQQMAWTYFANPAVQQEGLLPSQDYLDHLLAGESYLSAAYFERLCCQATSTEAS